MKRYCAFGGMKIFEARKSSKVVERLEDGKVRCDCGRVLKVSNAGFGAATSIPRHHRGVTEAKQ